MRSAILLLALVACAAATSWQTGREYVYEYRTRVATGIPALKNQVSGIGLKSDVVVQVQSPSELLVKMTELKVARIENEEFQTNWRLELPLQHYEQLNREQAEALRIPFKVLLRQGQVVAIEVDAEEPLYAVNIKRGLVSQLSLSLARDMRRLSTPEFSNNGIEKQMNSELSFEVEQEPSVSGKCRTRYTVVPLPEYVAKTEETDLPREIKEKNQERDAYVITKTRNFDECKERPGFVHSSLVDENELGSNGVDSHYKRYSARSSTTRYLVRGEPSQNFIVERVWTEGQYVIVPFATKTESMHVTSNQTLVLRKVESIRSPLPLPQRPIRRDVEFEQVQTNEPRLEQPESFLRTEEYKREARILTRDHPMYPKLTSRPNLIFANGIAEKHIPVREIQQQIKTLVRDVVRHVKEVENLSVNKPSEKVDKISEALIKLNLKEIEEIYRELVPSPKPTSDERKITKQILIDAIALAGTNPAIMFLKEKIMKHEIKREQAAQIIMTLPMTIKTPTPELLRELVQMTKAIKENESVWGTSLLAITTLIHRACVDQKVQRNNFFYQSYKFCTPEDVELVLPMLQKELSETMDHVKITYLVKALGNLGHPKALEMTRRVVVGQIPEKQVRAAAIYSIGRLARTTRSEHVIRIIKEMLMPIYQSVEEPVEVRIAAFVTLLCTRPNEEFFTEVATGTWFEQSQHVGQFVYTTLETLANLTYPTHMNISRKAALALPLAKPFKLGAHFSRNMVLTHSIPKREIASLMNIALISGKHSLIPETVYYRTNMFQGDFDIPMFEMSLQTQGIQKFINDLIVPTKEQGVPSEIDIQTRKDVPLRTTLWTKLVGQYERIFTLDSLKELLEEGLIEIDNKNTAKVNFQKTLTLHDMQAMFPTEAGFPILAVNKIPTLISVRGSVHVKSSEIFSRMFPKMPKKFTIKTDLKPFICQTQIIEAGVVSPLTHEIFSVGHKVHALATLPNKMDVEIDLEQKKFEIVTKKPTEGPSKVELVKFEAMPYTARTKVYDYVNKVVKPIVVLREPATRRSNYGEKTFGLNLEAEQVVDQPSIDMSELYHQMQPHTMVSSMQFWMLPHNLRLYKYKLTLNLPNSETEEARLVVKKIHQRQQWNVNPFQAEKNIESEYEIRRDERYEQLSEESQRFFKDPLAECGEECQEIRKEMLNVRDPESRRNLELVELEEKSEIPVHTIHAELQLKGRQTRKFRTSIVMKKTPSGLKQRLSVLYEKLIPSERTFIVRAHGQIEFPRLPLERSRIVDAPKTTLGHLIVEAGEPQKEHKIKASLVLAQTEEQKNAARNTPVVRECLEHETNGMPYTPACLEARLQATLLNKVILNVETEKTLPSSFRNMTYKLDDLVKYQLFPHMTQERIDIENPEKKVKIVMDFKPKTQRRPYTVLDLFMYKPKENTFFKTLQLTQTVDAIFPLSARVPLKEKALNQIMGKQYIPMCKIQPKMITTFDNVSLPIHMEDCYHLITKDCSKQVELQVFAKKTTQGKQIKFNVGPVEVEILPNREVLVDGKPIKVQEFGAELIKSEQLKETVLIVKRPIRKTIVVEAPVHGLRISSDGESFAVELSNVFRGRTCGLCGDMNGEKVAELKDPKGCVRTNPEVFAKSWTQKQCRQQQEVPECEREEVRPVHRSQEGMFFRQESGPLDYITAVEVRGDEVCFSVKPVAKCVLGHEATETTNVEMGFHCVTRGRAATEMISRAGNTILEEMFDKPVDFTEWLAVPQACQPIEVLV